MLTMLDALLFITIGCFILFGILLGLIVADVVERKGWAAWVALGSIVVTFIAFGWAIFKIRAHEPSWLLNGSSNNPSIETPLMSFQYN